MWMEMAEGMQIFLKESIWCFLFIIGLHDISHHFEVVART